MRFEKIIAVGLVVCSASVIGADATEGDVRGARWGDTEVSVRAREKAEKSDDSGDLYWVYLNGSKFLLYYQFTDVGLSAMSYTLDSRDGRVLSVLGAEAVCDSLRASLVEKYGAPARAYRGLTDALGLAESFDPVPSTFADWGVADVFLDAPEGQAELISSKLNFVFAWDVERSTIRLSLSWNRGFGSKTPFASCSALYTPGLTVLKELEARRKSATRDAL